MSVIYGGGGMRPGGGGGGTLGTRSVYDAGGGSVMLGSLSAADQRSSSNPFALAATAATAASSSAGSGSGSSVMASVGGMFKIVLENRWRTSDMPSTGIRNVAAGGGYVFVHTSSNRVVRWNTAISFLGAGDGATGLVATGGARRAGGADVAVKAAAVEVMNADRHGDIQRMFVSTYGNHCLLSTSLSGMDSLHYVYSKSVVVDSLDLRAPAPRCEKLAVSVGGTVESVTFFDTAMGDDRIVIGTSSGRLYECPLPGDASKQASARAICELLPESSQAISSVASQCLSEDGSQYLTLFTTSYPLCMYLLLTRKGAGTCVCRRSCAQACA
ncbi:hypothetical protein EON62_00285 [archaeon]|nr:MAG: hypothetical protein EON62_00285 [archaeon]